MNRGTMMQRVVNCARCGEDHDQVEFELLDRPVITVEHRLQWWGVCPTSKQPILMAVINT